MPADRHDVAVVGAGTVGLAVARELHARRPDAKLIVIDKADAVAQYQTGHNSGVIHAGVYYARAVSRRHLVARAGQGDRGLVRSRVRLRDRHR